MGWGASGRISDRIRIGMKVRAQVWEGLVPGPPPGVTTGRWISLGSVWVRLGSRSSWADEDLDAEMIKPVDP